MGIPGRQARKRNRKATGSPLFPRFFRLASRRGTVNLPAVQKLRTILYWVGFVLAVSLLIMAVGAVLGTLIWVVVGALAGAERTLGQLAQDGAYIGYRYARVWAGGIAIILAFVKAYENFSLRAWWKARKRLK